jgi:hypothetical protein
MLTTGNFANVASAMKLYYELKKKPQDQLTVNDLIHIRNMEQYAEWNNINL